MMSSIARGFVCFPGPSSSLPSLSLSPSPTTVFLLISDSSTILVMSSIRASSIIILRFTKPSKLSAVPVSVFSSWVFLGRRKDLQVFWIKPSRCSPWVSDPGRKDSMMCWISAVLTATETGSRNDKVSGWTTRIRITFDTTAEDMYPLLILRILFVQDYEYCMLLNKE